MAFTLPLWAKELARVYRGDSYNTFIMYGNIHDFEALPNGDGVTYGSLSDFLIKGWFADHDIVVTFDQAAGLKFNELSAAADFNSANKAREDYIKIKEIAKSVESGQRERYEGPGSRTAPPDIPSGELPRNPARALPLIGSYLDSRIRTNPDFRAAVIINYAHFIAPASLGYSFSQDDASCLITLHKWSCDPAITKADVTIILLTENLADLHPMLVRSPYTAKIQIPLPDQEQRAEYLLSHPDLKQGELQRISSLTAEEIAIQTAGLSRVNLDHLIKHGKELADYPPKPESPAPGETPPTSETGLPLLRLNLESLFEEKKALIEKECFGLLEFLKTRRGLDSLSGHEAAKAWLMEDAKLLKEGKLDALPMGYLICGPVGTGKTYLMTCYAGTLGIPCVKLMNFRSQWQGVTEGNWEKILNTLKATGPVAVIIDEADAALGDRSNNGDSGTSSRVFSMLAQQMGDTCYRGKILWFLLTCRPDLLPIDLKRQGRAEIHIPLFYPDTDDEKRNYFTILARKNGGTLEAKDVPAEALKLHLSGADIEGLTIRAKRRALLAGSPNIRAEDLDAVLKNFIPPSNSDEVELQVMAAVVECTHQDFLPPELRKIDRTEAVQRFAELKRQF